MMTRKQARQMKAFAGEVKKLELTKVFRNVQRVKENRCAFPADLTETEKDGLRILASAILKSKFMGDPYDVLRDAFEREQMRGRNRKS